VLPEKHDEERSINEYDGVRLGTVVLVCLTRTHGEFKDAIRFRQVCYATAGGIQTHAAAGDGRRHG
jgi:hypothetical protein